MSSVFLNGFADELIKEAGSGLGGRLSRSLLKKTIGVETAAAKTSREVAKATAAKKLKDASSLKGRALAAKDAVVSQGRRIGKMTKEQWAKLTPTQKKMVMAGGGTAAVGGAAYAGASRHGTGDGGGLKNLKGRQAATWTDSTKGGKVGNPSENPERFNKKAGFTDGYSIGKGVGARVTGPKAGKKLAPMKEVNLGSARPSTGVPSATRKPASKSLMGSVTGGLNFDKKMPSLPGQKKKTPSSQVSVGKATRLPGSSMSSSSIRDLQR
jgi:hypothetical protein